MKAFVTANVIISFIASVLAIFTFVSGKTTLRELTDSFTGKEREAVPAPAVDGPKPAIDGPQPVSKDSLLDSQPSTNKVDIWWVTCLKVVAVIYLGILLLACSVVALVAWIGLRLFGIDIWPWFVSVWMSYWNDLVIGWCWETGSTLNLIFGVVTFVVIGVLFEYFKESNEPTGTATTDAVT